MNFKTVPREAFVTLRRNWIRGVLTIRDIVRLRIDFSQRGTIGTVTSSGGNPVLAEAAVSAVKKWRYTPGLVTAKDVELVFNPFH